MDPKRERREQAHQSGVQSLTEKVHCADGTTDPQMDLLALTQLLSVWSFVCISENMKSTPFGRMTQRNVNGVCFDPRTTGVEKLALRN